MSVQDRPYMSLPLDDEAPESAPEPVSAKTKLRKPRLEETDLATDGLKAIKQAFAAVEKEIKDSKQREQELQSAVNVLTSKTKVLMNANASRPDLKPIVEGVCYLLQTITILPELPGNGLDRARILHCSEVGAALLSRMLLNQEDGIQYPAARLAGETALREYGAFCDRVRGTHVAIGFDPILLGM